MVDKGTIVAVGVLVALYPQEPLPDTCGTPPPAAPIVEVGAFSNTRDTDEHAYGETVLLWRAGACIFGLFESAQGLQGDTPIGELQEVVHNPDTGALRFSARLTVGIISGRTLAAPEPSRDLFTFDGTMSVGRLTGALTHVTQLNSRAPARHVTLTASARGAELMKGPTTYGAWRAKWEPILKVRAPNSALQSNASLVLGEVARDLTGDGRPETLRVVGVGRTTDTFNPTLTIESAGRTVFRVALAPLTRTMGFDAGRRTMFAEEYQVWLDEFGQQFFAPEKFQRPAQFVDGLRAMAPGRIAEIPDVIRRDRGPDGRDASAIWQEILESPVTIFTFSPGGDRIEAIGWNAQDGRFYRLLECC